MLEDSVSETNGIRSLYEVIDKSQCNKLWLTISPKPQKELDYSDVIHWWFPDFNQAFRLFSNFILVIELNEKDQIHFHIFGNFETTHNKITFSKRWLNKWYHDAIIKPIWARAPKLGCDYLFKTVDYMREYLDGVCKPIIMYISDIGHDLGLDNFSED